MAKTESRSAAELAGDRAFREEMEATEPEGRFCVNCVHYAAASEPLCLHESSKLGADPVTGRTNRRTCGLMRTLIHPCGPDGQHYQRMGPYIACPAVQHVRPPRSVYTAVPFIAFAFCAFWLVYWLQS